MWTIRFSGYDTSISLKFPLPIQLSPLTGASFEEQRSQTGVHMVLIIQNIGREDMRILSISSNLSGDLGFHDEQELLKSIQYISCTGAIQAALLDSEYCRFGGVLTIKNLNTMHLLNIHVQTENILDCYGRTLSIVKCL